MRSLFAYRRVVFGVLAVGGVLTVALWPKTATVDLAAVTRGSLVITVDEDGQTRVRDRFVVSAPVGGRVLRIEVDPGDRVRRGDTVARLEDAPAPLLDARTREEARAVVDGAKAALGRAQMEEQRAQTALAHARRELDRTARLVDAGALPTQERDDRELEVRLAEEAMSAASFDVRAAAADVLQAEARIDAAPSRVRGRTVAVRAPTDGVILRRLRESESIVPAGEPLIELGDPANLEIVSDLLSTDAVRVRPGARAYIEQWGSEQPLSAIVRRVEPAGFTKVSALGVEEQRVNVILDLEDSGREDDVLGDGYRVDVRIVIWEAGSVVKVPTAALFRDHERWAVYVVRDGRAHLVPIEIGRQTGREAEVLRGLDEGARVIVHPPDSITDGTRVTAGEGTS
jgi:HlyD family secretion protein